MDKYDIKRFGLILAVQAEIEAMKVTNNVKSFNGEMPAYYEEVFMDKADELRNIVNAHDEQL